MQDPTNSGNNQSSDQSNVVQLGSTKLNDEQSTQIKNLAASLRGELKKLSHNELSRMYVNLYSNFVLLNKQLDTLKDSLKNEEQLKELLDKARSKND